MTVTWERECRRYFGSFFLQNVSCCEFCVTSYRSAAERQQREHDGGCLLWFE